MKNLIITAILSVLLLNACNNPSSSTSNNDASNKKPNDEFRKEVLSKITLQNDTLQMMDTLLNMLDAKGVSFQKYVAHSFYELQDSVDHVVNIKFPEHAEGIPSEKAYEYHHAILSTAIDSYNKSLGIDDRWSEFVQYMFVSDEVIKEFCNNYRVSIPEQLALPSDTSKPGE